VSNDCRPTFQRCVLPPSSGMSVQKSPHFHAVLLNKVEHENIIYQYQFYIIIVTFILSRFPLFGTVEERHPDSHDVTVFLF
jgi:hypothetical protein